MREELIDPDSLELLAHLPVSEGAPVPRFEVIRTPMVKWRSNIAGTGYAVYNATASSFWDRPVSGEQGFRDFSVVAKTKQGDVVESVVWGWNELPFCQ